MSGRAVLCAAPLALALVLGTGAARAVLPGGCVQERRIGQRPELRVYVAPDRTCTGRLTEVWVAEPFTAARCEDRYLTFPVLLGSQLPPGVCDAEAGVIVAVGRWADFRITVGGRDDDPAARFAFVDVAPGIYRFTMTPPPAPPSRPLLTLLCGWALVGREPVAAGDLIVPVTGAELRRGPAGSAR